MDDIIAKPEAGEIAFDLNGIPVILRADFEALSAIETRLGCGLFALAHRAQAANLTSRELGTIICEAIRAAGRARGHEPWTLYGHARVSEELFKGGFVHAQMPAARWLVLALNGGRDPQKKDEAATEMTAES